MKYSILLCFLSLAAIAGAQTNAITTEHGYRFYHHISTNGPKPRPGETIKAYVNVFVGDTLLSSSRINLGGTYKYDLPPASQHLEHYPPIYDAALLMSVGDSATIYQPLDTSMLKYIPKGARDQRELRFEIAMAQIITAEEKAKAEQAFAARAAELKTQALATVKQYAEGKMDDKLTATKSGLKIMILDKGAGRAVQQGVPVQVHYYGMLKDGTVFDNSYDHHHPLAFPAGVGQMIPGFDEGIMMLNHGGRAYLFIPPALGYGDQEAANGAIPPNSELIFYIEVL